MEKIEQLDSRIDEKVAAIPYAKVDFPSPVRDTMMIEALYFIARCTLKIADILSRK